MGLADLHIHTTHSDGMASVEAVLDYAEYHTALDVVAIADHDQVRGALAALEWVAARPSARLEVVFGTEISASWGRHLLAYFFEPPFPTKPFPRHRSLGYTAALVHDYGGIVVIPHPLCRWTPSVGQRALTRLLAQAVPYRRNRGLQRQRGSARPGAAHSPAQRRALAAPGAREQRRSPSRPDRERLDRVPRLDAGRPGRCAARGHGTCSLGRGSRCRRDAGPRAASIPRVGREAAPRAERCVLTPAQPAPGSDLTDGPHLAPQATSIPTCAGIDERRLGSGSEGPRLHRRRTARRGLAGCTLRRYFRTANWLGSYRSDCRYASSAPVKSPRYCNSRPTMV